MRILLFVALAIGLLAGLWLLLRPAAQAPAAAVTAAPAQAAAQTAAQTPEPAATPAVRRFTLAVPAAPGSENLLRVQQGERVELTVTSTESDELHLHGYDLSLRLDRGEPATLSFTAEHAGRFEIELHHHHGELGVLEVSPR